MKIIWAHALIIPLGIFSVYHSLFDKKRNVILFHTFWNMSMQTTLAFSPLGIPLFLFSLYSQKNSLKKSFYPLALIYFIFWILPAAEALQNNGGNLALIIQTELKRSHSLSIMDSLMTLDRFWFGKFATGYLSVLILLISFSISLFMRETNILLQLSSVSIASFILTVVMISGQRDSLDYYLAYTWIILIISVFIAISPLQAELQKIIALPALILMMILSRPDQIFIHYRSDNLWNNTPYSEILELASALKSDMKSEKSIHIWTEGANSNAVTLSFLYIFQRNHIAVSMPGPGIPNYRIHLKPLLCPANLLYESKHYCLFRYD